MTFLKVTFYSFAAVAILTVSPSAYANSTNTQNPFLADAISDKSDLQYLRLFDVAALTHRGDRFLGSTRTATFYYKKGVKSFEKGDLEKAEQHFRAVLRADGSRGLDKATYHYLTNIKHKQGDSVQSKAYAQSYYNLN